MVVSFILQPGRRVLLEHVHQPDVVGAGAGDRGIPESDSCREPTRKTNWKQGSNIAQNYAARRVRPEQRQLQHESTKLPLHVAHAFES